MAIAEPPVDTGTSPGEIAAALVAAPNETARRMLLGRLVQSASAEDVAAVANALKAESERQLPLLPARAQAIAALIGEVAAITGREDLAALGKMATADALRDQGQYVAALAAYDEAGSLYAALGDDVGWARTRIGAAGARCYTGELDAALRDGAAAREILQAHEVWFRLARLESTVGAVLREQGRPLDAVAAYDRALVAAARLPSGSRELMEAEVGINRAVGHLRLDDYARSEALLRGAAETFLRHGALSYMAQAEANRARVLGAQGHLSQAIALVNETRATLRRLGRNSEAAMVGQAGVECWLRLNRAAEAAALADGVVSELEDSGAGIELGKALLLRASAREELGRHEEATEDLGRAVAIFTAGGCAGWVAVARLQRAEVLGRAASWPEALAEAGAVALELGEQRQPVGAARAELVRAQALRALGDGDGAASAGRAALAVARRCRVPSLAYQAWRLLGEIDRDCGRDRASLRAFRQAVAALEEGQGRILTEQRASFLAGKLSVYDETIHLTLQAGNARTAFRYAERAKGRALLDALALRADDVGVRPSTPAAQVLADELAALRRRRSRLSNGLFDSASSSATRGLSVTSEDGVAALRAELLLCEGRSAAVLEELRLSRAADVERLALLQGRVYSPGRLLGRHTALVEYVVVRDALAIFVLRQGRDVQAAWAPEPDAARRAAQLVALLDLSLDQAASLSYDRERLRLHERHTRAVLQRLHALLLEPVRGLLDGATRLVIVPHGVLHRVPFAALHDSERYLVETQEVALAPSASAVAFCRRPLTRSSDGRTRALVVGHSASGALTGALDEARLVSSLFPGTCLLEEEATVDTVRRHAAAAGLIHLAAHGLSRPDAPLFSHIQLADGQLAALDCLDLGLDCALVTLSACETGRAVMAPGDEPIGLTRSLLYAGARSVLHSLWRIDDQATQRQMAHFYGLLRRGAGRAAALRAAQLGSLRDAGAGNSHPFFWAAFGLVGDWGPLVRRTAV